MKMEDKSKNLKESKLFKEKVQQLLEVAQAKGHRKRQPTHGQTKITPEPLVIKKSDTCKEQSHPVAPNPTSQSMNSETVAFKHARSDTKLRKAYVSNSNSKQFKF